MAMNFKNGLAQVTHKDKREAYINQSAEFVWLNK
ncbi:hypothetical protein MNBD_GAMMA09-1140 [hydrothermal vent metagenome]|uniref:Uncharacterized protein n=1 Tax=hydrothermal vent metagenome TaxID=652676 RepID=A0A3B0XI30_9ZZZZ